MKRKNIIMLLILKAFLQATPLNGAAGPLFQLQQGLTALKSKLAQLGEALDNLANPMVKAEDLIKHSTLLVGIDLQKLTSKTLKNFKTKLKEAKQIIPNKKAKSDYLTNLFWKKIIDLMAVENLITADEILQDLEEKNNWYSTDDIPQNLDHALKETQKELARRATPSTATGSGGTPTGGTPKTGGGTATGTGGSGGGTTSGGSVDLLAQAQRLTRITSNTATLSEVTEYLKNIRDSGGKQDTNLKSINSLRELGNLQNNLKRLKEKPLRKKVETRIYHYINSHIIETISNQQQLEQFKKHLERLQKRATKTPPAIDIASTDIQTLLQRVENRITAIKPASSTGPSIPTGPTIQTSKDAIDALCGQITTNIAFSSTNLDGGPHSFFVKNKNKIGSLQEIANKQATDGSDLTEVFNYFIQQVKMLNLTKAQLDNIFGNTPKEIKEGLGMVASATDVEAAKEKEELGKLKLIIKNLNDFFTSPIKFKMNQGKDLARFEKDKLQAPHLNNCDASITYFQTHPPVHNASDITQEMTALKTLLESIKNYLETKRATPVLTTTCDNFIAQINTVITRL
ncbi:hypothetical protein K2X40_03850 [Candidatus Babeliales bacterium]|nr:hypothetical protein [Candidatus Babeliales bacterium]